MKITNFFLNSELFRIAYDRFLYNIDDKYVKKYVRFQ